MPYFPLYPQFTNRSIRFRFFLFGFSGLLLGLISLGAVRLPLSANATPADSLMPPNQQAAHVAIKISVSKSGIQVISGQMLADVGFDLATLNPGMLQLFYFGQETALSVNDDNQNGRLDADEEMRFYAQTPGDRWNKEDVYWLSIGDSPGKRMSIRSTLPQNAPLRTTAFEHGIWQDYQIYKSQMPGIDDDHWYSQCLPRAEDNFPVKIIQTHTITFNNILPLATDSPLTSVFTLTGAGAYGRSHELEINVGGYRQTHRWNSYSFYESWQFETSTQSHAQQISLTLLSSNTPNSVCLDKVQWQQPVLLDFGSMGAAFSGVAGIWQYQLSNTPEVRTLYDVTNPLSPIILPIPTGANFSFEDGPDAHDYLLAGPGTEHVPTLESHTPVHFPEDTGADAVYIAPAHFIDELMPLVALRQSQGYTVKVVDVADIYNAWSYGAVSPDAIRNFLRFAKKRWNPGLIAATLVGDSTTDPHNYLGQLDGHFNRNIIPPYLAFVDPWIGETACQNCYAQLDGDDPLLDEKFLIDIWIGRLSVQTEAQLRDVVDKIVRYETAADEDAEWRNTAVFIADDYIRSNGTVETVGDFAAASDEIINDWMSASVRVKRMYYDPRPGGVIEPWREPDPVLARTKTFDLLSAGAGLVTMTGHANHFQFAVTEFELPKGWLLGFNDVLDLTNRDRLFISLQMTSRTSQFSWVSTTGTTIDEVCCATPMVGLWPFGAGLAVMHGQDALQKGFHETLWPPIRPDLESLLRLVTSPYLVHKAVVKVYGIAICCWGIR
ncbi:hypothetical protein KFU94_57940 [Chloroflexi bacterium TSY]|nr:hypothetical protein [Chloroflexi bacterium TSY]